MTVLTSKELDEFTILNSVAYSLWRTKSAGNGDDAQCWLCMEEVAKNKARYDVVVWMNNKVRPAIPFTEETVGAYIEDTTCDINALQNKVERWKKDEISLKILRNS